MPNLEQAASDGEREPVGPRRTMTSYERRADESRQSPRFAPGQRESERASRLSSSNHLHSQAFAPSGHCERATPSRREPREGVRKPRRMRSHFSLVANRRRGSVNRSPQGAIRGGFAVSPQNSEPFARCACRDGALAGARRERRASAMSAAWDSSPALSPVPWGERNGEAFNCVPGG